LEERPQRSENSNFKKEKKRRMPKKETPQRNFLLKLIDLETGMQQNTDITIYKKMQQK